MSARPLRVGVIGAGRITPLHLNALAALPGVEVTTIADVRLEAAAAMAARFGIPEAVGSVDALLARPVDVVHSCVANVAHAEVAQRVIEAGRHIVAEKPLALDVDEARGLAEAVDAAGVHAFVCFVRRHVPAVIRLRAEVADAGGAHLVRGGYLQDWLLGRSDWDWRLDPLLSGPSSTLADLGGHFFDTVEFVTGRRVVSLLATLGRLHDERLAGDPPAPRRVELEDHALVTARLEGGALVTATLSQVTAGWSDRLFLEVSLAESTLAWSYEDPAALQVGRRDAGFSPERVEPELPPDFSAFSAFVPDVYRTIAGEQPNAAPATFRDGLHSVQLVAAALRSSASGAWADVPGS